MLLVVGHSTVAVPRPVVAAFACTADYTCKHNIVAARSTAGLQLGFALLPLLIEQLAFAVDPRLLPPDSHLEQQDLHRAS